MWEVIRGCNSLGKAWKKSRGLGDKFTLTRGCLLLHILKLDNTMLELLSTFEKELSIKMFGSTEKKHFLGQ
jgi:hypothetical protein